MKSPMLVCSGRGIRLLASSCVGCLEFAGLQWMNPSKLISICLMALNDLDYRKELKSYITKINDYRTSPKIDMIMNRLNLIKKKTIQDCKCLLDLIALDKDKPITFKAFFLLLIKDDLFQRFASEGTTPGLPRGKNIFGFSQVNFYAQQQGIDSPFNKGTRKCLGEGMIVDLMVSSALNYFIQEYVEIEIPFNDKVYCVRKYDDRFECRELNVRYYIRSKKIETIDSSKDRHDYLFNSVLSVDGVEELFGQTKPKLDVGLMNDRFGNNLNLNERDIYNMIYSSVAPEKFKHQYYRFSRQMTFKDDTKKIIDANFKMIDTALSFDGIG